MDKDAVAEAISRASNRMRATQSVKEQFEVQLTVGHGTRQLNDHAAHLQQAFAQAEAKMKPFEVAAQSPSASEERAWELKRDKEGLQRQMRKAQRPGMPRDGGSNSNSRG
jgi:hypothetical protein